MVLIAFVAVLLGTGLLAATPLGAQQDRLELMIFPLECEVDLLNTGVNQILQVTPEDCLERPVQPLSPSQAPPSATGDNGGAASQSLPALRSFGGVPPISNPGSNGGDRLAGPPSAGFNSVQRGDVTLSEPPDLRLPLAALGIALLLVSYPLLTRTAAWQHLNKVIRAIRRRKDG